MAKTLKVKGNKEDGRVILWERHKNHPNGEIFVVNDGREYEVFSTPAVRRLIEEKRLSEVKGLTQVESKKEEEVPPLRNATESEEKSAGLTTEVEKETAKVPVDKDSRKKG